jgi:hypothetical protein
MVTDEDRFAATELRDSMGFKVSDKELFSAIFDVVDVEKVKELLSERRAAKVQNSEMEKIKKLEAKLKEKLQKLQTVETEEKKEKVA